jgi:hypothetical protein
MLSGPEAEHIPHWVVLLLFFAGGPVAIWAICKKVLWPLMADTVLALLRAKGPDVASWIRSESMFAKDIANRESLSARIDTLERLCSSNADAVTAIAAAQLHQGEALRQLPGIAGTLREVSKTMRALNSVAISNAEDIGELRGMITAMSGAATIPGRRHYARRATDPQPADDGDEIIAPELPYVE